MINPQPVATTPKHSLRNLKKYLPQLKMMAKKEGLSEEKKDKEDTKKPISAATVISVFKDEKVYLKV